MTIENPFDTIGGVEQHVARILNKVCTHILTRFPSTRGSVGSTEK